jgi:hypothetical protein
MSTLRQSAVAFLSIVGIAVSIAIAQPTKDTKPPAAPAKPAQPEKPKQPAQPAAPGMPSPEEMAAYAKASTPGPMQEFLAQDVGRWDGKVKMWEAPNTPPAESACTTVFSTMMDGRYVKGETEGTMGGMPFKGFGLYAYDNVSEKFQSVWIDNFGTGIANGTGELSADHKTLTWTMTFFDPMTKKQTAMREVDHHTESGAVLEMYAPGKDGKEFKMMEITYSRAKGSAPAAEKPKAPAAKPPAEKK